MVVAVVKETLSLSGHSDVVMGALMLNDDKKAERLRFLQNGIVKLASLIYSITIAV